MSSLNRDFLDVLSSFNAERVEYMVVGAYALAAHGLPRATGDIDLWVRPTRDNAQRVERALITFGAPADQFNRSDFESDDLILQVGVPPGRVDVITSIESVSFDEAWPNRIVVELDGISGGSLGRLVGIGTAALVLVAAAAMFVLLNRAPATAALQQATQLTRSAGVQEMPRISNDSKAVAYRPLSHGRCAVYRQQCAGDCCQGDQQRND